MHRKRFLALSAGALAFPAAALAAPLDVAISVSDPDGMNLTGTQTVTVSASPATNLVNAELYVDSVLAKQTPTSPLVYQWDTTKVANGTHTLRGDAVYRKRRSTSQIAVTVNNVLTGSGYGTHAWAEAWGG